MWQRRLKRGAQRVTVSELIPRSPTLALSVKALCRRHERELLTLEERFWGPNQTTSNEEVHLRPHLAERSRDVRGLVSHIRKLAIELCQPRVWFRMHVDSVVRQ